MISLGLIQIEVLECVDTSFPLWVKCCLVDVDAKKWYFIEKQPIILESTNLTLPQSTFIKVKIIEINNGVLIVNTSYPLGLESEEGASVFKLEISKVHFL